MILTQNKFSDQRLDDVPPGTLVYPATCTFIPLDDGDEYAGNYWVSKPDDSDASAFRPRTMELFPALIISHDEEYTRVVTSLGAVFMSKSSLISVERT